MHAARPLSGNPPAAALADLHWLLGSPSLLPASLLPEDVALGDATLGEAWWQQSNPRRLQAAISDMALPAPFRLGRYAEQLMTIALRQLPGHQLLASQLPLRTGGISQGEFDYLLQPPAPAPLLHIELAVKVYLAVETAHGMRYVGPGLRDAFDLKLQHLCHHQLRLADSPAGRKALADFGPVQPMAWVRGWVFYYQPTDVARARPTLAAGHLHGWWRRWGEALPSCRPDSRWAALPKARWLASGHAQDSMPLFDAWEAEIAGHFAQSRQPMMVAEYAPPSLGGAELARGMIVPDDWPDPNMLAILGERIAKVI